VCNTASAQGIGAWDFSEAVIQGAATHSAAIRATGVISSGSTADYAPVYSITCTAGDPLHWKQQLQLDEPITSRGLITLAVTVDRKDARDEQWTVTGNKRIVSRFDVPAIAEIKTAQSLKLEWNWGWSWLWLSDKAKFDLQGVRSVVYTLAKKCGIAEP
jgi:hypothetical protein